MSSSNKLFFQIPYEFDINQVHSRIDCQLKEKEKGYICVSDGVILSKVVHDKDYRTTIQNSLFSICDSGWVPLFMKWIYGKKVVQYCGSDIFRDYIQACKYKMAFLGSSQSVLNSLKDNLCKIDPRIADMLFWELPFNKVEEFDYPAIADRLNKEHCDLIWVALGAPKQERFMELLEPHLNRGVMLGVGAVFNFFGNQRIRRAPNWMIRCKMEFLYRIICEPKKQLKRCCLIVWTIPGLLIREYWKVHFGKETTT